MFLEREELLCCRRQMPSEQLETWPSLEIACVWVTSVGAAAAKVPFQVIALVDCSMVVKRSLPGGFLHGKREIALRIDGAVERVSILRGNGKGAAQGGKALLLHDMYRNVRCLAGCFIGH